MTENHSDGNELTAEQSRRLAQAWESAVEFTDIPPGSVERAFFRGVNVRVKFPAAFVAAYDMIMAGVAISAAIATHAAWPKAAVDSYRAACSVFAAMVETMEPLEYVTAVTLSRHKDGLSPAELEKEANTFLDDPKTKRFGWHLGMTDKLVEQAASDRYPGWLPSTLQRLESAGFLTRNGDFLIPREKNVEWKFGY
jgi:hypothetical protein